MKWADILVSTAINNHPNLPFSALFSMSRQAFERRRLFSTAFFAGFNHLCVYCAHAFSITFLPATPIACLHNLHAVGY
jgi:hypothetical protein